MLQVLGHSHQEQDWQRLLFHFLSPDAAHGLDDALLEHLLQALADREELEFQYSRFDLPDVQIEQEVSTPRGRPDAVIWAGEEWFICWELKVTATESTGQTQAYVEVNSFDSIDLSKTRVQPSGHNYVYLAPADADPPTADAFVHLSWEWLASELQSFLEQSHGAYPAATTAKLDELTRTIRRALTMTEFQENQDEKAKLYLEYYDEIAATEEAFESQWSDFADTWGTRLAEMMDGAKVVEVAGLDEANVAVEFPNSAGNSERWIFRQNDSDWAGIVKDGWWRGNTDHTPVYEQTADGNCYRLSFYHRLDQNREQAVRDHTLELQLWHGTDNGDDFMYSFRDILAEKVETNADIQPPTVDLTNKRGNPLVATYDIPVDSHDSFHAAYIAALEKALLDLTVEHSAFINLIDDTFEETLVRE